MTAYNYAASTFTAMVGNIDANVLRQEIATALPGPAAVLFSGRKGLHFIDDDSAADPRYRIDFDGTLTAPEKTTLDGVVAAHVGPSAPAAAGAEILRIIHTWYRNDNSQVYIPFGGWDGESLDPASIDVRILLPGDYRLLEIQVWHTDPSPSGNTVFSLRKDGSEIASKSVAMSTAYQMYTYDFRAEDNEILQHEEVVIGCKPQNNSPGRIRCWTIWEGLT